MSDGTLHPEHLADLVQSSANRIAMDRQTFYLSRSLGLSEGETRTRVEQLLVRHAVEWKSFVDSLGPESFVTHWTSGG